MEHSSDNLLELEEKSKTLVVDDKINFRILLPLLILQFAETWNSDSLFSYVSYLVVDFKPGITKDEAGIYAGLVAGTFFVGNFCSSYLWGLLSDKFGRKKLLIAGASGTLCSIILFGFSTSIAWAVLSRALSGSGKTVVFFFFFLTFYFHP